MSHNNPFAPPQSDVAEPIDTSDTAIDSLPVSDTWKRRFRFIKKAGGPSMANLKTMPKEERKGAFQFNILAFLFGPFYYLAKGMWKKGLSLFLICLSAVIALEVILVMIGFPQLGKALGYGVAAVFAMRANIDYYKKMVLDENGWW